jgi:hypothetical protein
MALKALSFFAFGGRPQKREEEREERSLPGS